MADRILVWYMENIDRDGVDMGPAFYIEQDYTPVAVRVMARRSADASNLQFTIKDDGVTIFSRQGTLTKGATLDDAAEELPKNPPRIAEGSLVTLDVTPNGAKGITVQLELDKD